MSTSSFKESYRFIGYLAPFLTIFLILCITFLNGNYMGGMIYFVSIGAVMLTCKAIANIIFKDSNKKWIATHAPSYLCSLFTSSSDAFPSTSSAIISFTLFYILLSFAYQDTPMNIFSILLFVMIFVVNAFTQRTAQCSSFGSLSLSAFVGLFYGWIVCAILHASKNEKYLIFSELSSTRALCTKKQKLFKCSVKKNGQLVRDRTFDVSRNDEKESDE